MFALSFSGYKTIRYEVAFTLVISGNAESDKPYFNKSLSILKGPAFLKKGLITVV